jgi:hypothetical protein
MTLGGHVCSSRGRDLTPAVAFVDSAAAQAASNRSRGGAASAPGDTACAGMSGV